MHRCRKIEDNLLCRATQPTERSLGVTKPLKRRRTFGSAPELCGVNLLERLLRILQRLGFRSAIVFSTTPKIIGVELAKHSWAREQITVHLASGAIGPLTAQLVLEQSPSERLLIVPANIYCDARLLAALCAKDSSAALVDSNPPEFARPLVRNPCGPALITRDFLVVFSPTAPFFDELKNKIDNRKVDIVDAAEEDAYIVKMRRRVRPLCFPAPPEQDRRLAERVIIDAAQKGTLDLPAYFHAPIETGIISLLCKTRILPFICGEAANFRTFSTSSLCSSDRTYWMNSRNAGQRWRKAACWMTLHHSTVLSG